MEIILFLIGIILAIVALAKAGEATKALRELRKSLEERDERLAALTRRIYRLEKQPEEHELQPTSIKEEMPPPAATYPKEVKSAHPPEEREAVPTAPAPAPPRLPAPVKPTGETLPVPAVDGRDTWSRFEEAVGKRWMTWLGVLVLFFSAGFFLKYAFDRDWIGPGTQILIACAGGLALLGTGHRLLRKDMRALGQGLIGGGLMILYAAIFAAFSPNVYGEPVISNQKLVFAMMCLVTAAGVALAIRHDAIAISFLAALGGFLTPVLVSTGTDARDTLFAYVLLLDLGIMAVALYRRWRALDILAFFGTAALFTGWFLDYYEPDAMAPTLLWLGAFFVVFLVLPFVNHLRRGTPVTVERFVMAIANAAFVFGFAFHILHDGHDPALSRIALGIAAAYLVMGVLTRKRIPRDERSLFGFIAMAVLFLTISVPLRFGMNGITLVWLGEASVLLYLGYKFRYYPVRVWGFIVLLLGIGHVFVVHWEGTMHAGPFTPFLNGEFLMLMCAPIGAAVFAAIHQAWRRTAEADDRFLKLLCTIGAGLLALFFLHVELEQWLAYRAGGRVPDAGYLKGCALTVLWALGAAGFLGGGLGGKSPAVRWAGALPLFIAFLLAAGLYSGSLSHEYMIFLNGRFGAGLLVCALFFAFSIAARGHDLRAWIATGAGFTALALLHAETQQWIGLRASQWACDGGYAADCFLSLLWVTGSLAMLAGGIRGRSGIPRNAGLAALLLGSVYAVSLFGFDLTDYLPVLNARFLVPLAACGALFAHSFVRRRYRKMLGEEEQALAAFLFWCAIVCLLALLSSEPRLWYGTTVADPVRARWLAQMSVTIVWGVYASALLSIGFWRRARPLRLAALGLFALTAAKLALVDLATLRQIYRIITFFVLGLLMIGASYLYHRAERRLKEAGR